MMLRSLTVVLLLAAAPPWAVAQTNSAPSYDELVALVRQALKDGAIKPRPPIIEYANDGLWFDFAYIPDEIVTYRQSEPPPPPLSDDPAPPPPIDTTDAPAPAENPVPLSDDPNSIDVKTPLNPWMYYPYSGIVTIELLKQSRTTAEQQQNWKPYWTRMETVLRREMTQIEEFARTRPRVEGKVLEGRELFRTPEFQKLMTDLMDLDDSVNFIFVEHLRRAADETKKILRQRTIPIDDPEVPPPPPKFRSAPFKPWQAFQFHLRPFDGLGGGFGSPIASFDKIHSGSPDAPNAGPPTPNEGPNEGPRGDAKRVTNYYAVDDVPKAMFVMNELQYRIATSKTLPTLSPDSMAWLPLTRVSTGGETSADYWVCNQNGQYRLRVEWEKGGSKVYKIDVSKIDLTDAEVKPDSQPRFHGKPAKKRNAAPE